MWRGLPKEGRSVNGKGVWSLGFRLGWLLKTRENVEDLGSNFKPRARESFTSFLKQKNVPGGRKHGPKDRFTPSEGLQSLQPWWAWGGCSAIPSAAHCVMPQERCQAVSPRGRSKDPSVPGRGLPSSA